MVGRGSVAEGRCFLGGSEAPHINDYTVTSTCTSSAHYNVVTAALQNVVLQAIPIPFSSTNRFSIGMWREGLET